MKGILFKELSDRVIGAAFKVHRILGPGLLESAYEGALVIELRRQGLSLGRQEVYPLFYQGELAGAYVADLVVGTIPLCAVGGVVSNRGLVF